MNCHYLVKKSYVKQLGPKYLLWLLISETVLIRETVFRCACGHGDMRTGPHKVLAATLTLFQPGGTDYAHRITASTPGFENLRTSLRIYLHFKYILAR